MCSLLTPRPFVGARLAADWWAARRGAVRASSVTPLPYLPRTGVMPSSLPRQVVYAFSLFFSSILFIANFHLLLRAAVTPSVTLYRTCLVTSTCLVCYAFLCFLPLFFSKLFMPFLSSFCLHVFHLIHC